MKRTQPIPAYLSRSLLALAVVALAIATAASARAQTTVTLWVDEAEDVVEYEYTYSATGDSILSTGRRLTSPGDISDPFTGMSYSPTRGTLFVIDGFVSNPLTEFDLCDFKAKAGGGGPDPTNLSLVGLAFVDGNFYAQRGADVIELFFRQPENMGGKFTAVSIIDLIPNSGNGGLAGRDGRMFSVKAGTPEIVELDPSNPLFRQAVPVTGFTPGGGLAFDGNYLFVTDNDPMVDTIYRVLPNGVRVGQANLGSGIGADALAVSTPTVPICPPSFVPSLWLSHEVKEMKGTPKFEKLDVTLDDQFETGLFEVKKLKTLYNPADLIGSGEGVIDRDTHLVGYEIKLAKTDPPQPKHEQQTHIEVVNQFGTLIVDTEKPDRLLIPSAKSVIGPVGPLPFPVMLDHFKCYKVRVSEGADEFPDGVQVTVRDQFTAPRLYDVDDPTRLCNPVDKDGEGILNFDDHLMCYDVRRVDIANIHINNQFGPLRVETKKEKKELCLPSTKTLLMP